MIRSYIKTSGRNVMRNKLFSSINVVGLAISMSVGLILIAFVHDILSFDRYNQNGDRIYRIANHVVYKDQNAEDFASTSRKAGKFIRERVSGVEDVVTLTSLVADASFGDNAFQVNGYWADPSMFSVFTLPMKAGNPATALKDPYSVVLTETSAKRLFGNDNALGRSIKLDTIDFQVTGVIRDVPFYSHFNFEILASRSLEQQGNNWADGWQHYAYALLSKDANLSNIQLQIDAFAEQENLTMDNATFYPKLQPLYSIVVGPELGNANGPNMSPKILWLIAGLALVVILSACFNYTNLSIARALRRFKEIGLRKVIGAMKRQVMLQFLAESVIISLIALLLSFPLFLVLRPQLIDLAPELQKMVKLELSVTMIIAFFMFSVLVGVIAGLLPAVFFAKVTVLNAIRNAANVRIFENIGLRRILIVIQYSLTLIFITTTIIGYKQYRSILAFDLGFKTENILNVDMSWAEDAEFVRQLNQMPEVKGLSRSLVISGIGQYWHGVIKYKDPHDSTRIAMNVVDENYLPLHEYQLLAGRNFQNTSDIAKLMTEVIVNETAVKRFDIGGGDPEKAIGEEVTMTGIYGNKVTIVGVLRDFHYGKLDNKIEPVAFMQWLPVMKCQVNIKIQSDDIIGTMATIEQIYKSIDRVHPFKAKFYDDQIEAAYSEFSSMIKIIGFLSFLAISIASMGLFGMVVFTTETRLKEISIRKVLGATSANLLFLLGQSFLILLAISAVVALPVTYIVFENVILTNFPFHDPVGVSELFAGLLGVLLIAFAMIGSQTLKAARSNPAEVLKSE